MTRFYVPASEFASRLTADDDAPAREFAAWKARVQSAWPEVAVRHVESGGVDAVPEVGDQLHLRAFVSLGGLDPDDVVVEAAYGSSLADDDLANVRRTALDPAASDLARDPSTTVFAGAIELDRAGSFGYTVRVMPKSALLVSPAEMGLIASAG